MNTATNKATEIDNAKLAHSAAWDTYEATPNPENYAAIEEASLRWSIALAIAKGTAVAAQMAK